MSRLSTPRSTACNGPKYLKRDQKALIVHTVEVQVRDTKPREHDCKSEPASQRPDKPKLSHSMHRNSQSGAPTSKARRECSCYARKLLCS